MEQTVQKALNLLEALVRSGQPRRLTELSRELGLTKPNVYRLLSTLSVLGYVKKDPDTSLYSPTLKLWEMGSMLVRDVDLVSVANPRLRRLCEETREAGQLTTFDAGYVVYVGKVDSAQPLKAMTNIGPRLARTGGQPGNEQLAVAERAFGRVLVTGVAVRERADLDLALDADHLEDDPVRLPVRQQVHQAVRRRIRFDPIEEDLRPGVVGT